MSQETKQAFKGALLSNPVFDYAVFEPVEAAQILSVAGASANVSETTLSLQNLVVVPPNTAAIQYRIAINSTATAAGTMFSLRHKSGGVDALVAVSQIVGFANYAQGLVAANSGQVTYAATKGSATAFTYVIWVTGFIRSY